MTLHSWVCRAVACVGLAVTSGCGDDLGANGGDTASESGGTGDSTGTSSSGGTGDSGGVAPAIEWRACSLVTDGAGDAAECATVEVPLDWDQPEGETIEVFVKRIAGSGPDRSQVWLLTGGPGNSGASLEELLALPLRERLPASDIYLVDHRGVGRSTRLGCPEQETPGIDGIDPPEWPACIEYLQSTWGPRLGAFNTTDAARDVGALIAWTRAPDQPVHVYGVSYGTYWAQRYLQLFPEQPTSVTLDSLCQAGLCSLDQFDRWVDHVGRQFMGVCGEDMVCAGKLGDDPLAAMAAFLDGLDDGACAGLSAAGVNRTLARQLFAAFVGTLETRTLIPALVYRGNRCSAGDVAAFEHLIAVLSAPPDPASAPAEAGFYSQVLSYNVAVSEMMQLERPPLAEALALQEQALFWTGDVASEYALYDLWPRYARDEFVGGYATTTVPMLLMNGTLDPQTPIEFADEIAPHYAGPQQTFVAIPEAPHAVAIRTPTLTAPHTPCGLAMFAGFVADPQAPIDTACLADIVPLDFHGDPATVAAMLGTGDAWEDGAPLRAPASLAGSRRVIDEVRRAFRRARGAAP